MTEQKSPLELIYKDSPPDSLKKRLSVQVANRNLSISLKPSEESAFPNLKEGNATNLPQNHTSLSPDQAKRRRGRFLGIKKLIDRNNSIHLSIDHPIITSASIQLDQFISLKQMIIGVLTSPLYTVYILTITLIYLYYDDFRTFTVNAHNDNWLDGFLLLLMLLLLIDFMCSLIFIEDYVPSLFFVNELLACAVMVFEVDRVLLSFASHFFKGSNNVDKAYLHVDNQNQLLFITRLVKLVKLLRIARLYKAFFVLLRAREVKQRIKSAKEKIDGQKKKIAQKVRMKSMKIIRHDNTTHSNNRAESHANNESIPNSNLKMIVNNTLTLRQLNKGEQSTQKVMPSSILRSKTAIASLEKKALQSKDEEEPKIVVEDYEESKVSQQISDSTIKKMIIITFLIFLVNLLIDKDVESKNTSSYSFLINYLNAIQSLPDKSNPFPEPSIFLHWLIDKNIDTSFYPIIFLTYNNSLIYRNTSLSSNSKDYRYDEISFVYNSIDTMIAFSTRKESKLISITNISRTAYITIALFLLSFLINLDGRRLILKPLNKMIDVVNVVSKDPVNSKTLDELKAEIDSNIKSQKKKDEDMLDTEITTIQMAIIRICSLMAIGFGEAGGEILKENISSSQTLNPMLPGQRVQAIFGFCFIRRFSEINDALQERTMVFVNQISDIVHSSVDKFCGISNKNLGDCFLLVWKFNGKTSKDEENELKTALPKEEMISFYADSALLSYLNIIKKINKSQVVLNYRKDKALIAKFGSKFSIQMGFGLHSGWGIEGAIGSFFKIDCSYLSPNVNIAARLETATHIYGVDVLFSGELYDLLSPSMKKISREIDIVTLKGSETPVRLYTVDINKNIQPGKLKNRKTRMNIREKRLFYFNKKKKLLHTYDTHCKRKTILEVYCKMSKGMRQLLTLKRSEMFTSFFDEGFMSYINGDWEDAYENLNKALYLDKNDGPTKTIIDYIKKLDLKAPSDWDGYRVLLSKS